MDTSDEWIRTRTGIAERRIGGSTIGLSVESGRQALEMAGLEPSRIDALVLATTTPDWQWGNAPAVQNELDLFCGAFDLNAACSGLRVRAGDRPRADRDGCRPCARHRHGHAVAHHRLGATGPPHRCSRTARAPW